MKYEEHEWHEIPEEFTHTNKLVIDDGRKYYWCSKCSSVTDKPEWIEKGTCTRE